MEQPNKAREAADGYRVVYEKLKESEEYLRFFLKYAPAALAMFDLDMRYLNLSQRWRSDYGLEDRDVIGVSHYQVFPEIPRRWREVHRRGLAGEVIREEAEPFERADGTVQWVRWEVRPWYKLDGQVGGIVIFTEDITDRKRVEDALRKSEFEFRMLAESMPQIVWICSPEGRNIYFNQQWGEYTGLSLEDSYGDGWIKPFHPDDRSGAWNAWERAIRHATTYAVECRLRRADGVYRWWLIRGVPVLDQVGAVQKWFGTCTDIEELKQSEEEKRGLEQQFQQAQKLESLGVLAGGIAHDFNNLLAVIMGHCSLAELDYSKSEDHIREIGRAATRAADLCREMLAYAGKAKFAKKVIDLRALVLEMVKMLKATIPQNVAIGTALPEQVAPVKADASQVRQVVMNLIINAAEAIGEAQGEVEVALSHTVIDASASLKDYLGQAIPPRAYVCLEVSDTGCGMDEETYNRIFEPFFSTKFAGRGLGMSAVLGIVRSHDGAIQLSTRKGAGTTFKVYFPAESGDAVRESPNGPHGQWKGSGTVLLVEDEDVVARVAQAMLEELGFTVLVAANGAQGLEAFRRHAGEIVLVVTDVGMPVMDGYELLAELKKLAPELPVIVSSGFGEVDLTTRIAPAKVAGVISKPYRLDQLREVVRNCFERRAGG